LVKQESFSPGVLKRLRYDDGPFDRLTHYLFRYPAKFHPPVIRALLEEYTRPGDRVLDPFCGSGSLLVEAAVSGRNAVGTDIDPVAVFISDVKTRRFNISHLSKSCERLLSRLKLQWRPVDEYYERQFADLNEEEFLRIIQEEKLWIPSIPNISHWFRRYVVIDLARIHRTIRRLKAPRTHKNFLYLCFAAIIRNSSNADPIPVSGLEVTAHMRRREAQGRVINPHNLFEKAVRNSLESVTEFSEKTKVNARVIARQADALTISSRIRTSVDAVITSPPYHNAVDYYRRHQLEMFWLGFTPRQEDRLALSPLYIGRLQVATRHPFLSQTSVFSPLAQKWELKIRQESPARANAFKHYMVSMGKAMDELARVVLKGGYTIFVIGHSTWRGEELPSAELFLELAEGNFRIEDHLWYPIKNRYMSYQRRNGDGINREHVLVFRRS